MKKSKNQSYVFTNKKLNAIVPNTNCLTTTAPDMISCSDSATCRPTSGAAAVSAAVYQSHNDVYLTADNAQGGMLTSPQTLQHQPATPSVPASSAYRGSHGFELSFLPANKEKKMSTWTYSSTLKKLFVRMANTCPVRFKTSPGHSPPPNSIIRLMPVYIKPENVQEVVRRCPNHSSKPEYNESHPAPQHLLFCTHNRAQYVEDPYTGRLSVVIPHEQSQAGTEWVTYLVKFMCFSSCVGGLNRRPVQLIFTLEHNNVVLGRQSVEIRICACPVRDRRTEEKGAAPAKRVSSKSASTTGQDGSKAKKSRRPADRDESGPKQRRLTTQEEEEEEEEEDEEEEENTDKVYTLTVHGRENLVLLKRIRDSLEIAALMTKGDRQMLTEQQQEIRQQQPQQPQQHQQLYTNPASSKSHQTSQQQFQILPQLPKLPAYSHPSTTTSQLPYGSSSGGAVAIPDGCNRSANDDHMTENEVTSSCIASSFMYNQQMFVDGHEDVTITSWLNHLDLSLYVDYFHQLGLYLMHELQNFSLHDLDSMNIGMPNRNKIWRALVEYRNRNDSTHPATLVASGVEGLVPSHSSASVVMEPAEAADRHIYEPAGYYTEVMYMSDVVQQHNIKEEDHNYCHGDIQ